ncbi:DUF7282 domain-containing protein [Profundibacterium mesophilum]|uniref:DUF7282 domain-containing protein n=1 Tax=Profundibacterium mesophilum KAUST100406-0324 TaxID=1037889 RepID=A0A921NVA2_9RHOB|nr:hypothetical protein [Profundibacterium mesophilum]KAF0676263.1 hypothetical protein PMES_01420 [Profundibacterium mesophilum KAUST100406-0324]
MTRFTTATAILAALTASAASAQTMINTDGASFKGSTVRFQNIEAPNKGYLVIHATENGEAVVPGSLGHAMLEAGTNDEVRIDIGEEFEADTTYVAMMHDETNGNDSYDFGEGSTDVDTPTMSGDNAVTREFIVSKAMLSGSAADQNNNEADRDADDVAQGLDNGMSENESSDDGQMKDHDGMSKDGDMDMDTNMSVDADGVDHSMMMPSVTSEQIRISGNKATFSQVHASQNGYLVVHAVENGEPVVPGALGHTSVDAGISEDVTVTIDAPFEKGTSYVAMLHTETNGNDMYEFGEGMTDVDVPAMADGQPVVLSFTNK